MRVLVTGGAGFIGSHVVDALLATGAEVAVLDSFVGARRVDASAVDPRVTLIPADLTDAEATARAVAGVDAVCHQAAKVGLGVDFSDVTAYARANDLGTATLLQALWQRSFQGRLVLASSMVVYGEGRTSCPRHGQMSPLPRRAEDLAAGRFEPRCPHDSCTETTTWMSVDETAPPDPRNVYAATKLHQEHLCTVWAREAGATVVALRYHNVYGPRMPRDTPYSGVAAIFRSALQAGRGPTVFEDGGQTRDFVHVRDVARANVIALTGASVPAGAYNIASGVPHTVAEMAAAMAETFGPGTPRPVVTSQWRLGDVRHIVASSEKAASVLGFTAGITFEAGIAEFAQAEAGAA